MPNAKERLDSLTETILNENHPGKQRAACRELYDFFCEIIGLDDEKGNSEIQNGTILLHGKAISPVNAARCLWEYKRTARFLHGVAAAIADLKKRFPNERLEIVYAGCGPFASLVTPLLNKFSPADIKLTLIDYHEFSLTAARKIFEVCGFENFAAEFIQTDACAYKHSRAPHLVISETMQNALLNETQTAITLNLAPQIRAGGVFVPQEIAVEACFAKFGSEFVERERIHLGKIFALDAEKIRRGARLDFGKTSFEIPEAAREKNLSLMLLTKIQIFDSISLDDYDSSITYPKMVRPAVNLSEFRRVAFEYILDEKPRFEHQFSL